ncbi:phage tail protein [Algibacter pacificus]|uniref:phage tail protein n=1 Tax=Algibacter pacificus TaxID=2599389 RepID=UPI0011CB9341|nr:tail fiber protein [Algibacter pacificus]
MDEYIGIIKIFAGNFAPKGWLFCHGQLLPIAGNTTLYSLIGTTYGGDGRSTFALPDFRGRTPIGAGQGYGFSNYKLGAQGGKEKVSLSLEEMPSHSHEASLQIASPLERGSQTYTKAANHYLADGNTYSDIKNNTMPMDTIAVNKSGNGAAHDNMQPFIAVNYIICLEGIFPPRP